jgi:ketosteroid isomerase-like protein
MNTQQNKDFVMEGYRLFQAGDIGSLLDRYHDDAQWIGPELDHVPYAGNFHGKQGIADFFAKLGAAAEVTRFVPTRVVAEGDHVVVSGESSWVARATGRSYDSPWVHVFTMRDGKVARFESFYDTAAAERAFQPAPSGKATRSAPAHH